MTSSMSPCASLLLTGLIGLAKEARVRRMETTMETTMEPTTTAEPTTTTSNAEPSITTKNLQTIVTTPSPSSNTGLEIALPLVLVILGVTVFVIYRRKQQRTLNSKPDVKPLELTAPIQSDPRSQVEVATCRKQTIRGLIRSMHGADFRISQIGNPILGPSSLQNSKDEYDTHTSPLVRAGRMVGNDHKASIAYLTDVAARLRDRANSLGTEFESKGETEAYAMIQKVGVDQPCTASREPNNAIKNRYGNVLAYDHSRVLLPIEYDDPNTDYINANYVDGFRQPRAYIAAQGPVPNSFTSFWRMIWYEKIETILMVTNEVERGRIKCHRYWPDPAHGGPEKMSFGQHIEVVHKSSEEKPDWTVRRFGVKFNGKERTITHIMYTSWPDHGVPTSSAELFQLREEVAASSTNLSVPIVVHCSAGVGRTGTYIGLDILVKQCCASAGLLDVDYCISTLRKARNLMASVQNENIAGPSLTEENIYDFAKHGDQINESLSAEYEPKPQFAGVNAHDYEPDYELASSVIPESHKKTLSRPTSPVSQSTVWNKIPTKYSDKNSGVACARPSIRFRSDHEAFGASQTDDTNMRRLTPRETRAARRALLGLEPLWSQSTPAAQTFAEKTPVSIESPLSVGERDSSIYSIEETYSSMKSGDSAVIVDTMIEKNANDPAYVTPLKLSHSESVGVGSWIKKNESTLSELAQMQPQGIELANPETKSGSFKPKEIDYPNGFNPLLRRESRSTSYEGALDKCIGESIIEAKTPERRAREVSFNFEEGSVGRLVAAATAAVSKNCEPTLPTAGTSPQKVISPEKLKQQGSTEMSGFAITTAAAKRIQAGHRTYM